MGKRMNTAVFLDLDLSTVVTALIIPLALTILGVWLAMKWRDKLRVRVVPRMKDAEFQELSALYCDRVPDYERVPPKHFRAFFGREYSARSVRDFRRRTKASDGPVHLLLVARTSKDICGFLKAIFVPDTRCLFLAYLVTARANNNEEGSVAQLLLSSVLTACRTTTIQSIVCEICVQSQSTHGAKARLFRHYASAHGLQLRRIEAKYQQPEICAFDAGDCTLTEAQLYIAYLDSPVQNAWASMTRDQYQALVSAIYKNVYLMSYALAEPQLRDRYVAFLKGVTKSLFAATRSKTVDLK